MRADVLIIGAGLAGLQVSRQLASDGFDVLLVDQKRDLREGIRTTGIFVRQSLNDFDVPDRFLGPPIRRVVLFSPALRPVNLESSRDEFRVSRVGDLYLHYLEECRRAGVRFLPSTRFEDGRLVRGERPEPFRARFVIGADGVHSRVACTLGLSVNRQCLIALEEVIEASVGGSRRLEVYLDPDLAPGYIAWLVDDGTGEIHAGVGGVAARFDPRRALHLFKQRIGVQGLVRERRGGWIPVGGVLANIANSHGLLVGDAAGAVSPLTAGGFDPCLRLSRLAADVAREVLAGNHAAIHSYSGRHFRLRHKVFLRRAFASIRNRTLIELGCALLRLPPLHALARSIFFGPGSFSEISELRRPSASLTAID